MNLSDMLPEIVAAGKSKKELKAVDEGWIYEIIINIIKKKKDVLKKIEKSRDFKQFKRSKEYKTLIKGIRSVLHVAYGTFQQQLKLRSELFDELCAAHQNEQKNAIDINRRILATHTSTKERLTLYPSLYKRLFGHTGIPKVLLDVSCGLNPFSYHWMDAEIFYIATEINAEDCKFIKDYFQIAKINGQVIRLDVIKEHEKLALLNADVCFVWKLLDTLEYLEHGITKKILRNLKAKYLIISFSTKTLSGKKMKKTRRLWFERICSELQLKFVIEEFENELFYILKKSC